VAQNNGVQVRRVTMTNNNGVKQIEAEEGNRKVKIKDDPNNGIEMEVTETKDGKEATQKYQAKNAEELKKNHPEAHKIYEQYNNGPAQAPLAPAADAARRITQMRIDSLQRSLESLERSLDQLENGLGKEKTKEIKQHLETVKQELSEAKKKLTDEPPVRPPQP
jgi:exonuclease VII small subunit